MNTKSAKLTRSMRNALELARESGGVLRRCPGGFWAAPEFATRDDLPARSVQPATINALVRRQAVKVIDWHKDAVGGPCAVAVMDAAQAVLPGTVDDPQHVRARNLLTQCKCRRIAVIASGAVQMELWGLPSGRAVIVQFYANMNGVEFYLQAPHLPPLPMNARDGRAEEVRRDPINWQEVHRMLAGLPVWEGGVS